ncbi:MAG: TolC family outer membrane protein [Rhizobiales bacterium]|nr:TolC family outer membrane protein [Hyphomicrobiales bacterium]
MSTASLPSAAQAESLAQALTSAYTSNPALQAERARQRATDEQVPQALSGWRPTIVATGDGGVDYNRTRSNTSPALTTTKKTTGPAGLSIELNQPVFRGFRTVNETKRAESNVEAGRQNLLAVEQQVLFDASTAFMNVVRDRQIVNLRVKNVTFLREQLRAAQARFNVGEITRTDVAQSRARLSLSISNLAVAKSNLRTSEANFVRFVGHQPRKLSHIKILRRLPKTMQQAIAVAEQANPNVLAATHLEDASVYNTEAVKGNLLPTVSLQARYDYRENPGARTNSNESASLLGVLQIPLYQAGRVYSEVREAKQLSSQRRLETLDVRRQVRETAVSAWHALIASRQTIKSFTDQVNANQFALEGVRQEALVGSRTTLDVLDAEQELVDSQVNLVQARRDSIVAAYRLLGAIGKLTAHDLRLRIPIYDPEEHYVGTRDRLFGTNTETVD